MNASKMKQENIANWQMEKSNECQETEKKYRKNTTFQFQRKNNGLTTLGISWKIYGW